MCNALACLLVEEIKLSLLTEQSSLLLQKKVFIELLLQSQLPQELSPCAPWADPTCDLLNGKLSADIKAAHTAAEATRQAAVDAQETADAWRSGFTPSPAALAQQKYPVLSHFVSHDQKADTWSDK
jgi:hypothetical protein